MDRLLNATARAERHHFWFRGFRRFVSPLLAEVVAAHAGGRIDALDCGCGTGHNLELLRRYGRAWGIDLTWAGLAFAHAQGERLIARASAAQLPFADARFDLVTSFDVIYALPDDVERAAVAEMFRVLRPGGALLLNVAALDALRGNHSILSGEIRRYDRRGLTATLAAAGFVIERATYTHFSTLPLLAAVRAAQRVAGHTESQNEISVPAAPINAILSALLAVEGVALRVVDMPLGSSLLVLARKKEDRGSRKRMERQLPGSGFTSR